MHIENNRIKEIRKSLKLSQEAFGDAIGLTKSSISNIENGIRNVTDQHIKLICSEFNVNEEWIRYGKGGMFVQQVHFSLNQYAEKNKISPLEIDIIKSYMEVDPAIREGILSHFKEIFARHAETAATKDKIIPYKTEPGIIRIKEPKDSIKESDIDKEVAAYRAELEDEQKGATLSASDEEKGKSC